MPVPAGAVALMDEAELTVKLVAGMPPKKTPVAPEKLLPMMVTDAPATPEAGFTLDTIG
jgi:hypothetical protein